MMIQSTLERTPKAPELAPRQQIGTGVFVLALLLLTAGYTLVTTPSKSIGVSLVVRCESISAQVGRTLVEQGIAADSPELRRQKQLAFRTCVDDYDAFKRLAGTD